MFEGLKEALQYVNGLKEESMQPIVMEIGGKTYCNKQLDRYAREDLADAIHVNTLSAMVDYITGKREELREKMILHIISPKKVELYSGLLPERQRETLFICDAIVNEFRFDNYYDQERFLIELQANFVENDDLKLIMQVAGNIQAGTTADYSDDGISQKTTIKTGVQRVDVQVPNPVSLIPYRTFAEIDQPWKVGDSIGQTKEERPVILPSGRGFLRGSQNKDTESPIWTGRYRVLHLSALRDL